MAINIKRDILRQKNELLYHTTKAIEPWRFKEHDQIMLAFAKEFCGDSLPKRMGKRYQNYPVFRAKMEPDLNRATVKGMQWYNRFHRMFTIMPGMVNCTEFFRTIKVEESVTQCGNVGDVSYPAAITCEPFIEDMEGGEYDTFESEMREMGMRVRWLPDWSWFWPGRTGLFLITSHDPWEIRDVYETNKRQMWREIRPIRYRKLIPASPVATIG